VSVSVHIPPWQVSSAVSNFGHPPELYMIIKPWLSISFSSSTYNFRHCHKLCVRFSSLWVTPSFAVSSSMSASAAPFIATQSPLSWPYSYQTFDCPLLNCRRLVSIYQGSHRVFLPTEAVCLTLWNPRKPLSGLSTLCSSLRSVLSRFHASTLPHFSALIFHCFGPSLLWLLISDSSFLISHSWFLMPDYPLPVLSRRYNFSPRLTSLLATSRCCVRPPALLPSETSFFLLHCCILSTSWSITVRLAADSLVL